MVCVSARRKRVAILARPARGPRWALITFGSGTQNISQSITLIDYKPQDTGNLFNNVTYSNPSVAETALSHIFDFSQADNQAVTPHVASLAAQNLILQ